ncbi:MAG: hypothetical protein PHV42_03425 [Candidatus Pacebacteria bacterium]|nr:hypothetical protein [Candidatus Paceibacterota bacterium]
MNSYAYNTGYNSYSPYASHHRRDNYIENQYQNYLNLNYTYSNYVPNPATLTNCYYTMSYPPIYYGDCSQNNYTYIPPVYPVYSQPQQNYYYSNTGYQTPSANYIYGYSNGSWYPGYQPNGLLNNLFNNNCYYQNGYQVCY